MKFRDRLLEHQLVGVRFALNAALVVSLTLKAIADTYPIWAIASMIACLGSEQRMRPGISSSR
ncbi:MAG TPA: hypothetical protein VMK42_19870 [Anaeromyxobacteraceae bacterium]|nr:hypothetical protein [Anaeromyxobacteraceae bacterium]